MICTDHEIGYWVAKRVNGGYFKERSQSIGLKKDGKIVAGVIYQDYNNRSIVCHIAIDGRMTKDFLWVIFDYPFKVCEVEKIIVPVASENKKSNKIVTNMGFTEEARIKDCHPDGDIILYTLKREDCRFLGERYGKRFAITTTSA